MESRSEAPDADDERARALGYRVVLEGEPHARRQALLIERHPEIRDLYGYDRLTAAIVLALVAGQLAIATAIAATELSWGWMVLVALLVGGPVNHWCSMGIHECSHNLAAKTAFGNRAVAFLANVVLVIPSAMSFARHHRWHHVMLGVRGHDNDLPMDFEIKWIRGRLGKLFWLFGFLFFATCCRGFLRKPTGWEWLNIVFQLAAMGALWWVAGPYAIVYLFVCTLLGHGIHPVAGHWIHEHYQFHPGQETYSYYGPLNHVTFYVGYHNEHHDFMRIPGRRLPKLRSIAPEIYGQLESSNSWTRVMWRFVMDGELTHASRIVRSLATFRGDARARSQAAKKDPHPRSPHMANTGL